jgi:hypothetical protein
MTVDPVGGSSVCLVQRVVVPAGALCEMEMPERR